MGIKNLNRFLNDNCSKEAISKKNLKQFANKTIVIDTSIYLYKFLSEDALMENMYLFISILKSYRICPLFIFDGKPPLEKRDLLRQRRIDRKYAEEKYLTLKETTNDSMTRELQIELDQLKRQMTRVYDEDITKVKALMDAYGVNYYDAPGEADLLCAYFVKSGIAWACMSDDMDMFLYGCPFVIRNLSLMNHTVTLYDTKVILRDLEMSEETFCEIMVLSGTDYNLKSNTSLKETINWFYEYKKQSSDIGFYDWLVKYTKYINDIESLNNIFNLFQIENHNELEAWKNIDITNKPVSEKRLREIMEKDGFVFK
jgi:flap endonuclease-1